MVDALLLVTLLGVGFVVPSFFWAYAHLKKIKSETRRLQKLNVKMTEDLADRREIERELAHMASFSEMAPNPIMETDTTGNLHYMNPAALAAFPELQSTWTA